MFKLQTFDVYSRVRGKIFFHDFLKGITVNYLHCGSKPVCLNLTYLYFLWHVLHVFVLFLRVHSQLVLKQRQRNHKKVKLFTTQKINKAKKGDMNFT